MDAESILVGLNADQRAAVLHDHQKGSQLLILAGAGSGKTSVLTKRIQYRIASGVEPSNILALTFTAKAAAEMRERVQKLFPDAGVRLCTFHSLALFMLKQKVGNRFAYEILGFKKMPSPHESADRDFLWDLSKLKIPLNAVNREELFSGNFPRGINQKLDGLRQGVLNSGNVVFEDLIYLATRLLETDEEARKFFQEQWTEIMVDEYQDINPSQYRLVKALLGNRKELFVVGDDDQAIYGFRGADIGNINRFCDDFKDSTLIRLEWNYRSVPNILHLANDIFKNKPLRLRKVLRGGNMHGSKGNPIFKENRKPEVWYSENPVEEMVKVICRIKELRRDYDLEWSDFAILVRYNRQRLYYEETLHENSIPVAGVEIAENQILENGVHVETVHGSKGLQYAVVFYAGLAEGLTPGTCEGTASERKKQLAEERRLYYVGVTRAEAYLVLLYCRRRHWRGKLLEFKPSRFLPSQKQSRENKMPLILFRLYAGLGALGYMFIHIVFLPIICIIHRHDFDAWLDRKIQLFSAFCMRLLRIDLSIENQAMLAKVDWTRPVFVMGNHQSYVDIPVVFLAIERTIGFIAKAELGLIPFLNFWMKKIGCIMVNREKGGGAKKVREAMNQGRVPRIFIFPEGTRSKNGSLLPFKSGGFRLALETEATILPLAIRGTAESWEKRKNSKPCSVSVTVLEPVDLKNFVAEKSDVDPRRDIMPPIYDCIKEAL